MRNKQAPSKLHKFGYVINFISGFAVLGYLFVVIAIFLYSKYTGLTIPEIALSDFDSRFSFDHNISNANKGSQVVITADNGLFLNQKELAIMGVLSKNATNILEFGTGTGRTTWVMAKNSPATAKILTLNLLPSMMDEVRIDKDDWDATDSIASDSKYTEFFFDKSDIAHKITLKSIDSKLFDESTISEKFDLIFVDGGHSYSYVKNDTEKAFKLLAPGGVIVWDDADSISDVARYLNDLSKTKEIFHISNTKFAVYRDTAASN